MQIGGKFWVVADYPHLRIPKQLLREVPYRLLSPEGKLLYGAMLDRTNLSHKNRDKFTNQEREIYIYFPQTEIMDLLDCGHDKASKVLGELEKMGLIKTRRRGIGRPYEIVLIPIDWRTVRKNKNEQPEKPLRDSDKSDHPLCGKADGNNPEYNNTECIDPEYYVRRYIHYETGYDELVSRYDPAIVDRIINLAVSSICQESENLLIKNELLPADVVRDRFLNLRQEHVIHTMKTIKNATYTTEHSDAFVLNALYESTLKEQ